MIRYLFALVTLALCGVVHAASTYSLAHRPDVYFSDQAALCQTAIPDVQSFEPYRTVISSEPFGNSCKFSVKHNATGAVSHGLFKCVPSGASCQVLTHSCDAGTPSTLTWPFGVKDSPTGDIPPASAILPPWPVCQNGCMLEKAESVNCFSFPDEDPLKVYCEWDAKLTGQACSTSDEPTPPELPDSEPCAIDPSGPGCTDPTDPTDPGGGGDNGGGDNGGGDNGGGDTGGGDTGGGDNGGGTPGGGDNGGGTPGGGDNGGGGDNVAGGLGCEEALTCSGDSIQCSILNLQKRERCEGIDRLDFDEQKDGIEDFLSNEDFQPEEDEEVNVGDLFSEGTRFLPASGCPQPRTFSLTTGGGRSFEFSFEPLCQFASDLSFLIVAAAGVFFAIYIGRASGGE